MRLLVLLLVISMTATPFGGCSSAPKRAATEQQVAVDRIRAGALVIDVRTAEEFAGGHVQSALNIPHDVIAQHLDVMGPDRNREIVLYCRSGKRSGVAKDILEARGFGNVINGGGYGELAPLLRDSDNAT